jgi:glycosyltransferase involved in cell wall biosynthesis
MSFSKFKICFATGEFHPTIGGLSKSAFRIAEMLSDYGFEMHIIVPVEGDKISIINDPEMYGGLFVYRIQVGGDIKKSNGILLAKAIRQLDSKLNFDLFHGFFLSMSYACALVIKNHPRPLISSLRGSDAEFWSDPRMVNMLGVILKHTSCLTTVNNALLDVLLDKTDFVVKTKFIKNSIDLPSEPKWCSEKLKEGIIGTLGKFQMKKEIDILLDSFYEIDNNLKSKLLLIGGFPHDNLKELFNKKLEDLGIEKKTILTELVDKSVVTNYLSQLSVFVNTSSSEGFPNAVLEAASLGIPLVVASFDGVNDYCEHNKNALIVPVRDVKATTEAITSILTNRELAQKLSQGAIDLAKSLSPQTEKEQWVNLYSELIEGNLKTNSLPNNYV